MAAAGASETSGPGLPGARDRRRLVVLVGQDVPERGEVARELIGRGLAVVICGGPSSDPESCAILRDESCAIVDSVDAAVILPYPGHARGTAAGLVLCARSARAVVVAGHVRLDPAPATAVRTETTDPYAVGEAVERVLREIERRGR